MEKEPFPIGQLREGILSGEGEEEVKWEWEKDIDLFGKGNTADKYYGRELFI